MSQLEELVLYLPLYASTLFEEEFRRAKLVLSNVKVLRLDYPTLYVVTICPNVTKISFGGPSDWREISTRSALEDLGKTLGTASKLRHIELDELWQVYMLEGGDYLVLIRLIGQLC